MHSRKTYALYSERPRLDDIIASFRRMGKTGKGNRKNFKSFSNSNRNNTQIKFFKDEANKILPKNYSFTTSKEKQLQ